MVRKKLESAQKALIEQNNVARFNALKTLYNDKLINGASNPKKKYNHWKSYLSLNIIRIICVMQLHIIP